MVLARCCHKHKPFCCALKRGMRVFGQQSSSVLVQLQIQVLEFDLGSEVLLRFTLGLLCKPHFGEAVVANGVGVETHETCPKNSLP